MRQAATVAAVLLLTASAAEARPAPPGPRTPIRHFVVLMQENHSYDNYFGGYPRGDGLPRGSRSHPMRGRAAPDLPHDAATLATQRDGGRMDGFAPEARGHYERRDLRFYWNVADRYVLFDRFFASTDAGGAENHDYWIAGRPARPGRELTTVFDRLERRGVSWRFYVENYDARARYTGRRGPDPGAQAARVPLLNIPRYARNPSLRSHVVDLTHLYDDLATGRLPAVAYIAPASSSEHPPAGPEGGERLVRALVGALMRSPVWGSSAFMWTYDESGGWYDHVAPPGPAYGFRVPALLVSPYAKRGRVVSTPLETASIPRFIEDNWRLKPSATRDARAPGLGDAFDFSRPPRAPELLAAGRQAEPRRSSRPVIYSAYGSAALLFIVLLTVALRRPRLKRSAAPLLCLGVAAAALLGAPAARAATITTVPAVSGMRFEAGGRPFVTGADGSVRLPDRARRVRALDTEVAPGVRAAFDRWYGRGRIAALNLSYRVAPNYTDPAGERVDPALISRVDLRGSDGSLHSFVRGRQLWLRGNRVPPESAGHRSVSISYVADRVVVAGSSVVHRAQQRFFPSQSRHFDLRLLFFSARFTVRDALLGFPIGSAVRVRYPSGEEQRQPLGTGGDVTVRALPRGDYLVRAEAPGLASSRPLALSRNQVVDLRVVSWLDVAVVLLGLGSVGLALLFARRPARRAERL